MKESSRIAEKLYQFNKKGIFMIPRKIALNLIKYNEVNIFTFLFLQHSRHLQSTQHQGGE